jgi:hypothetical protein
MGWTFNKDCRTWTPLYVSRVFEDDHVMGIETYGSMVFSSMKQILNDVHDTDVSVVTLLRKQRSYSTHDDPNTESHLVVLWRIPDVIRNRRWGGLSTRIAGLGHP